MLDPKAQRSQHSSRGSPVSTTPAPPDERSPWPVRRQLPPSPLVRSSVQAYARSQEEQNESCLVQASNDATHRYYDYMYVSVVTLYLVQAFIFFKVSPVFVLFLLPIYPLVDLGRIHLHFSSFIFFVACINVCIVSKMYHLNRKNLSSRIDFF